MQRKTIDKAISYIGLTLAVVFLVSSAALFYTYNFIHGEVHTQLASQKIYFPEKGTPAFRALPASSQQAMADYTGTQLTTGAGAKVFADDYIANHLNSIGGGLTYSELSQKSMANPSDSKLAKQVDTVFKGEMLRGTLLNAYAFGTMGDIARFASIGALIAAVVLFILSLLGFRHAQKASSKKK